MELELKIWNVMSIGKASCKPFLWVQAKYYAWTIELLMRCSPAMFPASGATLPWFLQHPHLCGVHHHHHHFRWDLVFGPRGQGGLWIKKWSTWSTWSTSQHVHVPWYSNEKTHPKLIPRYLKKLQNHKTHQNHHWKHDDLPLGRCMQASPAVHRRSSCLTGRGTQPFVISAVTRNVETHVTVNPEWLSGCSGCSENFCQRALNPIWTEIH